MECYTYLRNVQDLLSDGKTPYERRFGKPFNWPITPFGSLVEYYPISAKYQSRIHQFGKKVLPALFLGYALYAVWIWKGDIFVADIEELETMDASEIYSKRLNAKEVIFPKENGIFIFPVADGRIKLLGGDQEVRSSTLIRERPIRGVKTTPQRTRLRDVKHARIWFSVWVDDDRTNSDYNIQNKIALYLELRMRGEIMLTVKTFPLNGETSDTNDNVKNQDQHKAHETRQWRDTLGEHVNVRVVLVFLVLVLFPLSHSFLAHTAWLKMFACLCQLIHAWSECFLWPPSSSPSSSFSHSSSTSSSSCYPSTSPRIRSNTVYSAFRRWCQRKSPSPTQVLSLKTTSSRRLMSSPSQSPRRCNGSPSNGSSRTWITTMPQLGRCSSMHTENKSILPARRPVCWSVVVVRVR